MKRFAAFLAVPAALAAASSATAAPARNGITTTHCVKALSPAKRTFSVAVVMRPVTHTRSMSVRFSLLQRLPGHAFTVVHAAGLGNWEGPAGQPTLGQEPGDVWHTSHAVSDLPAPANYKFRVGFRWLGARGKVLRQSTVLTGVCVQRELRPHLVVRHVQVKPTRKGSNYVATVSNTGASAAGRFKLQLADRGKLSDATVKRLPAYTTTTVTLAGGGCNASTPPTVTADPGHHVAVSSRAHSSLTVSCQKPAL